MTTYVVPTNPTDVEAAALDLIVRLPVEVLHTDELTAALQDFCGMLHAEGCFAGLSWADAKQIAAAVAFDIISRDDAADFLRNRARNGFAGVDWMDWRDREGVARALNIAAMAFGL